METHQQAAAGARKEEGSRAGDEGHDEADDEDAKAVKAERPSLSSLLLHADAMRRRAGGRALFQLATFCSSPAAVVCLGASVRRRRSKRSSGLWLGRFCLGAKRHAGRT